MYISPQYKHKSVIFERIKNIYTKPFVNTRYSFIVRDQFENIS